MFYNVKANGKETIENAYPMGVVGWGNQMMRIKLDFSEENTPSLFKYDKNSLIQIIEIVTVGTEEIKRILEPPRSA